MSFFDTLRKEVISFLPLFLSLPAPHKVSGPQKQFRHPVSCESGVHLGSTPKQKRAASLLCIFSGENTNTTKDFSLVVFSIGGNMRKAPPGRELSP